MRRMLTRRADRQPVDITGRVFDALTYLVVRPGQLVERRVLMDALWPNVVVEDGNLSQTIHTLRRVLGEKAGEHRYIVTVPGRGYQFVAEVKMRAAVGAPTAQPVQPAASAPPSRRPKWILAAGAIALLVVGVVGALTWRRSRAAGGPSGGLCSTFEGKRCGVSKRSRVAALSRPSEIMALPNITMSEGDESRPPDGIFMLLSTRNAGLYLPSFVS